MKPNLKKLLAEGFEVIEGDEVQVLDSDTERVIYNKKTDDYFRFNYVNNRDYFERKGDI